MGADLETAADDKDGQLALDALKRLGYEAPKSFADAVKLLSQASFKASKDLVVTNYDETKRTNLAVLRQLLNISSEAGETFLNVSILTSLSKS